MPFAEGTFDVVWTQDVLMNIAEKPRLFTEIHRVLRPGGHLAFQANLAGQVLGVSYPTFWADETRLSFLLPPEECRRLLVASGFQERAWYDTTAQAVAQAHTRLASGSEEAPAGDGPPTLGLGVLVATDLDVYWPICCGILPRGVWRRSWQSSSGRYRRAPRAKTGAGAPHGPQTGWPSQAEPL